jgi:hypothetical protein
LTSKAQLESSSSYFSFKSAAFERSQHGFQQV